MEVEGNSSTIRSFRYEDVFPSRGTSSSSVTSDEIDDHMKKLLRTLALSGGETPDEAGLYPIHLACRNFSTDANLIGTILCITPGAARLRVRRRSMGCQLASQATGGQSKANPSIPLKRKSSPSPSAQGTVTLEGSYPIHIALNSSASLDVVGLLVRQDADILVMGDDANRVPLSIALRRGSPIAILELLLSSNPKAAGISDKRKNYPLHHACARRIGRERIELALMKRLALAYPAALDKRNFNGETPLDLAQSGGLFDDDTINYLHELAYEDKDVIEAPDSYV